MSSSELQITLTAIDNATSVIDEFCGNVQDANTQISESTQQATELVQQAEESLSNNTSTAVSQIEASTNESCVSSNVTQSVYIAVHYPRLRRC